MLLLEMPHTLVEDICYDVACSGNAYDACQMREVNRFFERIATKAIAHAFFRKITANEARAMPKSFRDRLIYEFIGENDRKSSQLASHFHKVAAYLKEYTSSHLSEQFNPRSLPEWLDVVRNALSICGFRDCYDNPLREKDRKKVSSKTDEDEEPSVAASAFLVASIAGEIIIEDAMLHRGVSPTTECVYLGNPFEMACRVGNVRTVQKYLDAGQLKIVFGNSSALRFAVAGNHPEVVKLLVPHHDVDGMERIAFQAAQDGSQEALKAILGIYEFGDYNRNQAAIRKIAQRGWDDILRTMLEDCSADQAAPEARDYLLYDAALGGHLSSCQTLEAFGLTENLPRTEEAPTGKHILAAATGGNIDILHFLDRIGISVSAHSLEANVFIIAAQEGHVPLLELCITRKYDLKSHDVPKLHTFALFSAINHRRIDSVVTLARHLPLEVNALIVNVDSEMTTTSPLQAAIDAGSAEMVQLLLSLGACPHKYEHETVDLTEKECMRRSVYIGREMQREFGITSRSSIGLSDSIRRKTAHALRVLIAARDDVDSCRKRGAHSEAELIAAENGGRVSRAWKP